MILSHHTARPSNFHRTCGGLVPRPGLVIPYVGTTSLLDTSSCLSTLKAASHPFNYMSLILLLDVHSQGVDSHKISQQPFSFRYLRQIDAILLIGPILCVITTIRHSLFILSFTHYALPPITRVSYHHYK